MIRVNLVRRTIICTATTTALFLASMPFGFAQEAVRPEIAKPLQAANAMIKSANFKEALVKIREVDGAPNKTANETYFIESMRGRAASGAGEQDTIIKSFEAVVATGKAPAATQLKLLEALAGAAYRANDNAAAIKWATRYSLEGGSNPQIRTLLLQSYFRAGEYTNSVGGLLADIRADEQAGLTPPEQKLQLLANNYKRLNDTAMYTATVEKWRRNYPKTSRQPAVTPREPDGYFTSP